MARKDRPGFRRLLRAVLAVVAFILFVGIVAPFINAAPFAGRIQRALEASLGRKVQFDRVYLNLFSGPGFSLENVTIQEDPRYGLEPFAFVPTLQARVRVDKLLVGQIRFAGLNLVEPSLNLVKRSDGTWNAVELIDRLGAPQRSLLNLFAAFEISGGRIDFKFGDRKSTLYIADSDLSLYPERSGKLHIQFSGSPARTDRAGNGFGHLRGTIDWLLNPPNPQANQIEADIILDPSNLSELTTLIEGHDVGVHGTVSSHARVEGPATALRVVGDLRLGDVHRWDLLPASGEDWRIRYRGAVDLLANRLELETVPSQRSESSPVALRLRVNDFLTRPAWSVFARLNQAPVDDLLPLARRMGVDLPADVTLRGALDGVIAYSSTNGVDGTVSLQHASAVLPDAPPLETDFAQITVSTDNLHLEPAVVKTQSAGTLQTSGSYSLSDHRLNASLRFDEFPITTLKKTAAAWFGLPAPVSLLEDGTVTGHLQFAHQDVSPPAISIPPSSWSGEFQFSNARITPPGLAVPLRRAQAHVTFENSSLDLTHFSGIVGDQPFSGSYHYNALARRRERIALDLGAVDLTELENALSPTLQAQGFLARLRFTSRSVPAWLAERNLEGDLSVRQFSVNGTPLGPLASHFVWQGTKLDFSSVRLTLPEGQIAGSGNVDLASYSPRTHFDVDVTGFPWGGGTLNAGGEFRTIGTDADTLRHLHAGGTFSGEDIALSADDSFDKISGQFEFSVDEDGPALHLSKILAWQGEDAWDGSGLSRSDGKLVLDLQHAGRQLHLVGSLKPENTAAAPSLTSRIAPR